MKTQLTHNFLIILIMFIFVSGPNVYTQITFDKTYFGSYGYSGQRTSDNGYIIAGAASTSMGPSFGLTKTDAFGDTLWTKKYGMGIAYSVHQTNDDGFIIAGIKGNGGPTTRIWVIKTDSNGDTVWTKHYGTASSNERGRCVRQTSEGGYVIVGSTATYNLNGITDIWLIKTDENGDTLWTRNFGTSYGGFIDYGFYVQQTNDNGYVITGSLMHPINNVLSTNLCIIRTNENGDTLWTTILGGDLDDRGYCVQQTQDHGFIVTGQYMTGIPTDPIWNLWVIRTNADGDTLWTKILGEGIGNSVYETQDNGFVFGTTKRMGVSGSYLWLIRTDINGDTLWTKQFGSGSGNCVEETPDNGFLFIGTKAGGGLRLIKTNSAGMVSTINPDFLIDIPQRYELSQNFPNPFNPRTKFRLSIPHSDQVTISVYNITGQCIETVTKYLNAGEYSYEFNAGKIPSGIYFYRISTTSGFREARKMLLQK